MNDRQEKLLGQIYDAAFDPNLWVAVMEGLAEELSGEAACMTALDIFTGGGEGCTALVPEDTMQTYVSHWANANPLHEIGDALSYVGSWRPTTLRYEEWIDRETLRRSAFYNEFLSSINSENGIMMGLALIGTTTITMNVARSARRESFDDEELGRARRWQQHLARAVRLGRELQIGQSALDAVDQLALATRHRLFFLNGLGCIQRMSTAGEAMLVAGSIVRSVGGILTVVDPMEDRHLQRLIRKAASHRHALPSGGTMHLRGGRDGPITLTVAPLGPRGSASWSTEPIILVTLATDGEPTFTTELRLRHRFGLTPAETRLTLALMRGGTLREVADDAEVSINTVRTQLAAIFSKTGSRRQVDLVRMLSTFQQRGV